MKNLSDLSKCSAATYTQQLHKFIFREPCASHKRCRGELFSFPYHIKYYWKQLTQCATLWLERLLRYDQFLYHLAECNSAPKKLTRFIGTIIHRVWYPQRALSNMTFGINFLHLEYQINTHLSPDILYVCGKWRGLFQTNYLI